MNEKNTSEHERPNNHNFFFFTLLFHWLQFDAHLIADRDKTDQYLMDRCSHLLWHLGNLKEL